MKTHLRRKRGASLALPGPTLRFPTRAPPDQAELNTSCPGVEKGRLQASLLGVEPSGGGAGTTSAGEESETPLKFMAPPSSSILTSRQAWVRPRSRAGFKASAPVPGKRCPEYRVPGSHFSSSLLNKCRYAILGQGTRGPCRAMEENTSLCKGTDLRLGSQEEVSAKENAG